MKIKVVFVPNENGGLTAYVPGLPENFICVTEGDSKLETIRNIKEALELILVPEDDDLKDLEPGAIIEEIDI